MRRILMSRKIRDHVDEAIAAGAFVVPPKPVIEEEVLVEPTASPDPPYVLVERKLKAEPLPEAMAAALSKRTEEAI
jgi:hypothetical protein